MAADSPTRQHDTDRQSDLAVMDANEYKQKRRLERILDAMDNIPDQADRAKEQYFHGEIDADARRIMVQDAVKDAVWEAWNLLMDHERTCQRAADEAESENDEEPWAHSKYFIGHPERDPIGVIGQRESEDIVVWGLRDYFELDEVWTERWTENVSRRNGTDAEKEYSVTHTVPRKLSWRAALRLKEFLNEEHDMEIQFEAMEDRRPYDDWRDEFETGVYHGPDSVDLPHKDV